MGRRSDPAFLIRVAPAVQAQIRELAAVYREAGGTHLGDRAGRALHVRRPATGRLRGRRPAVGGVCAGGCSGAVVSVDAATAREAHYTDSRTEGDTAAAGCRVDERADAGPRGSGGGAGGGSGRRGRGGIAAASGGKERGAARLGPGPQCLFRSAHGRARKGLRQHGWYHG